jgi:hypothetical protein
LRIFLTVAAVGTALISVASPAFAALGGRAETVDTDRARLHARLNRSNLATSTQNELTLNDGTVTRQFTNAEGVVFAVSWNGPMRPDLRQIFGTYYPRLQSAAAKTARLHARVAFSANDADFVVRSGGHPGAFWGYAILPAKVPAGFDASRLVGQPQTEVLGR